ncbi:hypothetical protein DRO44_01495 [Candidatus Bathyarchaeota archaeon]|nr:MAG: hypothetical protein DRO44_01495 [Candidatus Bathyarchaeota archaeon]
MKKIILILFILLFVLSTITRINRTVQRVKAAPETIIVPDDYPTIQAAIGNASFGDIVFVRNGTYYENLVVYKSISLVGEDKNSVIIDGDKKGTVITIIADNVTIKNFTIINSGYQMYDSGILVNNCTGVIIDQNIISQTNDGIRLNYSNNNVISENEIFLASFGGIVLTSSTENVISSNNISACNYGTYIYTSDTNFVSKNMYSSNLYGIYLYSSTNNIIEGNTISLSYQVGLYITFYSGNNTFYHNNLENEKNAQSNMINIWDFAGEGNHWSDYAGEDLNEDGIGDTPYVLDSKNQDNCPLMGTFSTFDIAYKDEKYSITIISNSTISNVEFETSDGAGIGAIIFDALGPKNSGGFCRIKIPKQIIEGPYVVLIDGMELVPREIDVSNETYVCLYFSYFHNSSITITSSEILRLYYELLDNYLELQENFSNLNSTYYAVLQNYTSISDRFVKLQEDFNSSFNELLYLNQTFYNFVDEYALLLQNYTQLLQDFEVLNSDLQKLLDENSMQIQKIQSLVYILIATTAGFLLVTIYLSKQSSTSKLKDLKA